jgi:hypothetical protein
MEREREKRNITSLTDTREERRPVVSLRWYMLSSPNVWITHFLILDARNWGVWNERKRMNADKFFFVFIFLCFWHHAFCRSSTWAAKHEKRKQKDTNRG